jgi:hypothetical protein
MNAEVGVAAAKGRQPMSKWMAEISSPRMVMIAFTIVIVQGCMGRYALDRKPVKQLSEAERRSRSRVAFDHARERVHEVREGMSPSEVQAAMGAVIAVEENGDGHDQKKLMDGFLCKVSPVPLKERWLFGYDEGNVQLVGFAIEFARKDQDDDDWSVKRLDRTPTDDCPVVGDTHLD